MMKHHRIIKNKKITLTASVGLLLLGFSSLFTPLAQAYTITQSTTNEDNISVDIKQIDELKDVFAHTSSNPTNTLEQTLVSVLAKDKVGDFGNFTVNASPEDVLRYTYPNYSEAQLKNVTINAQQAVNWLHHVGYTATLVNRALTTDEIKKQLEQSSPIIPIMVNQNKANWLNHCLAGVLYAHDDVAIDGQKKLNKSFIKAMGYGETMIQDGQENQPITFQEQTESPDPLQASDSYLWTQTITDIKVDPSAVNAQTINTNVKDGVFQAKTTKAGNSSQVEFTDPLLNAMKNQVADSPLLTCSAQVQKKGWLPECQYGEPIGTMGEGLRLEAFKIKLRHLPKGLTGGIAYSAYVQKSGWQKEVTNGAIAGTVGKGLQAQAIKIRLTGNLSQDYSVYYATYSNKKWSNYVKDNAVSGAKNVKIEAISIRLVKKKKGNGPSEETEKAAVALANAYEDAQHQKTVSDLQKFAGIDNKTAITSQQIMDWYHNLGLEFDTQKGRFSKAQAMKMNQSGRLYFTFLKATKAPDNIQNFGAVGLGYMDNSSCYTPTLSYMNEPYTPIIAWVQRNGESFSQTNQRMKSYDYDKISTLDEMGKEVSNYQEEVTLYNIRAKDSNNRVDTSAPSNPQENTPTDIKATGAAYQNVQNFFASGVQGQEPWCSEYVNASEINLLNHATTQSASDTLVTAEKLIRALYPNVSGDQLKTMSGGTVKHTLDVLKDNYQVTADVEERALNFNEVKQELDAGNIIQMDLTDKDATEPQGSEENPGHAVAIVGYVLPADGDSSKAPYYKIWNPWGQEFYVSSASPTLTLGGVNYQWTRTWHNWHKIDRYAKISISDKLARQKVARMSNPNVASTFTIPNYLQPFEKSNVEQQNVANFGVPIAARALNGTVYEAMISCNKTKIFASKIVSGHPHNKLRAYGQTAQNFIANIKGMNSTQIDIAKWGFTNAILWALFALAQTIPGINALADAIELSLTTFWGGGIGVEDITLLATYIINFIHYQKGASSSFNQL